MRRLLLNGSPRGKESNSRLILGWLSEGLTEAGQEAPSVLDLARTHERAAHLQAVLAADEIVLALPLYCDSMPALVKGFVESLADVKEQLRGKRVAFIVQSGFPEAIHTEGLAAYLARLCTRLGFVHLGTINKGGIEGIRTQPPSRVAKIQKGFVRAGRELAEQGRFSPELVHKLAGPRTFGPIVRLVLRGLIKTGAIDSFWNAALKKNGAFERRFDAPYGPAY